MRFFVARRGSFQQWQVRLKKKTKGKEKLGNLSIHIVPHPLPPKMAGNEFHWRVLRKGTLRFEIAKKNKTKEVFRREEEEKVWPL